jgi:hypothetical protein
MTCQKKTERQRAEEALAVVDRKVEKLRKDVARLDREHRDAKTALTEAERLRTYRASHPALPQKPDSTTAPKDATP